ncbi:response regulator transcription factor [Motiliproteus sp. SC1-56]|uniref:response regulator n=1 Tax=Motiliproteus sp. SC1-56 TaxID=2799565 RepID=UPI001A8EDB70|nr:response regulator transcription factor [Motiliproteus sp. SC1-56]
MTRLLLADDHAVVRKGLIQILREAGIDAEVHEVSDGHEALAALRETTFDAVLLDISMPGKGGIEVLKQMRARGDQPPVLVLSMHSEEAYALHLIRAGAAGYLSKESAPAQLAEAIKKVLQGKRYISPEVAELLADSLSQRQAGSDEADEDDRHRQLSSREFEVFLQLAQGLGPTEIGRAMNLSAKTIASHRSRILRKMRLRTNAELTLYASRHGLI